MKLPLLFTIALSLFSCSQLWSQQNKADPNALDEWDWARAQWIAFKQMDDGMKIVPAVHGMGDKLGMKGIERSIVPMFRKSFTLTKQVKSARLNICGLGHYVLYINGSNVSDRFLSPGWTQYQKRCLFNTYDVSGYVRKGENALGVLVGNGFFNINRERYRKMVVAYGYPRLIYCLRIQYDDGTEATVVSDSTTKVNPSPITFSSIYGGEDYDARLEQPNWNRPRFDDSRWQRSKIVQDTIGKLVPETDYPLKVMQTFKPIKVRSSKTGRTIYDFGQNASGIVSLRVRGNKGAKVIVRPDELLDKRGNVTQKSGGGPFEFSYILKGKGMEEWQPDFSYYGFRFADVEVVEPESSKKKSKVLEIKLLHTRNSSPQVGNFSCSDTLFNKIFKLIRWGINSNLASVGTDCPHREKLGWLEVMYLMGPSMIYNYDLHLFFNKLVDDMTDAQLQDGLVPDIAPEFVHFEGGFSDSPEWGSASVVIPWLAYKWYGDEKVVAKAYPMMKKYVCYLQRKTKDCLLDYGLGDWYDLGPNSPGKAQLTPKSLTATAIYYYDLVLMKRMAEVLDKMEDVKIFDELSSKVQKAFLDKFLDSERNVVSTGSQTAYAMPLYVGLIPPRLYNAVLQNLIDSITQNNYKLTSGDIGYFFLVQVLSENDRSDLLYKMNNRSDTPGYGYQLQKGATALTESWAALPSPSNNHMMLGHLMSWFYQSLGGISQKSNSIAFDSIAIKPNPVGNINWVNCTFVSKKGKITSNWKLNEGCFLLYLEIPNGVVASVILPKDYLRKKCRVRSTITGKSIPVEVDNTGTFEIGPGKYRMVLK